MYIKLFEDFTNFSETRSYIIRDYFTHLIDDINQWFISGLLSKQNSELVQVEQTDEPIGTSRTLKLDFKDNNYDYTVTILLDYNMFDDESNKIKCCDLTIKRYDDDGNMLKIDEPNCDIVNISEDYIISKISNFDNPDEIKSEIANDITTSPSNNTPQQPEENKNNETF
jgi:hypothetical protein